MCIASPSFSPFFFLAVVKKWLFMRESEGREEANGKIKQQLDL